MEAKRKHTTHLMWNEREELIRICNDSIHFDPFHVHPDQTTLKVFVLVLAIFLGFFFCFHQQRLHIGTVCVCMFIFRYHLFSRSLLPSCGTFAIYILRKKNISLSLSLPFLFSNSENVQANMRREKKKSLTFTFPLFARVVAEINSIYEFHEALSLRCIRSPRV